MLANNKQSDVVILNIAVPPVPHYVTPLASRAMCKETRDLESPFKLKQLTILRFNYQKQLGIAGEK